jgi:hypothetical protein
MTTIIIIPQKNNNYDPSKFEISVERLGNDNSYEFYEKFPLNKNLRLDIKLHSNDRIGVEYEGIAQKITSPDHSDQQYDMIIEIVDPPNEIKISVYGPGGDPSKATSNIIENDVDVNVKSIHIKQPFEVKLTPSTGAPTPDQAFWEVINNNNLNFKEYRKFIDEVLTSDTGQINNTGEEKEVARKRLPFNRTEAYSLLKYATEKYVECYYYLKDYKENVELKDYLVGQDKITPYYDLIKTKIEEYFQKDNFDQSGFLKSNDDTTLIELIWSYWHEEGMVSQTMTALARRFQNIKNGPNDPLGNFALDPLRPLNNILWGYIQDAQHRLTATRRNYEYTSEYDLSVASTMKSGFNPADRRSKFLQSFHRLIYEATEYFVQADNTIIRPDGFKLLNALRDTHRILAEGAHNQFGDLPTVARIEMLIEQWILSRPEIREFLGARIMVPYEEPWMDRVDSMKALQGWDNTSITFYRDLAVYGEKIILGIRNGNWTNVTRRDHATNWADAFRDAIQRYIHSYYTVTGIDLAAKNVNINSQEKFLLPGVLIQQRILRDRGTFSRRP